MIVGLFGWVVCFDGIVVLWCGYVIDGGYLVVCEGCGFCM